MPNSPALTAGRLAQPPEPSAALRALQEKGLELPVSASTLVSPGSNPAVNASLKVSMSPLLPNSLNLEKPRPLEPAENWRRPSSVGSADTTVEEILNLYINLSQNSPESEYEIAFHLDDSEDEDGSNRMVHQPKAYRDTIAPLLEYQFRSEKLTVPSTPSPMSISSSPHPNRPLVDGSLPSLHLVPKVSPNLCATTSSATRCSKTSVQIAPKISPNMRPVNRVEEDHLRGLVAARVSEIVDSHMKPPPLDLTRSRPVSNMSEGSAPVHPAESAFFVDSDERESRDEMGSHLKAASRLGKKKRKGIQNSRNTKNTTRSEFQPPLGNLVFAPPPNFDDDLESYKYGYWKSHASASHPGEAPLTGPQRQDLISERRCPTAPGPDPSINGSPHTSAYGAYDSSRMAGTLSSRPSLRRREPQPAVPSSDYQKYGPVIWNEKKKKQRLRAAAKATQAAEKEAKKLAKARAKAGIKPHRGVNTQLDMDDASDKVSHQVPKLGLQNFFHSRPASSLAYSYVHTTSNSKNAGRQLIDVTSFAAGSSLRSRAPMAGPSSSSNKWSEASGDGRKKAGCMSRLLTSSEERRRQKMKESITIVWGGRLSAQTEYN